MSSLIVPPLDEEPWPTLGPEVCDFIEATWVYGPGELKGQAYEIEDEFRAWLYRTYEVFPRGHERAGWRRFKRCILSIRKGTAKTEKGAIVSLTELHDEAPVRFDGWDASGNPVGRSIVDPYIPMLAYSKDQSEDLGYAVAMAILQESDEVDRFDVGDERILLLDARGMKAGELKALAGSPSARDGARTSFQNFDETHRLYLPGHVKAHTTMTQNTFKRRDADAWTMEQSTAPEAGQGSVHETAMEYAEQIRDGKAKDPRMFFFHRQGTQPEGGLETREQVRDYLLEASGPSAKWSADIEGLVDHYFEPTCDHPYFWRVWGNEKTAGGGKAFDYVRWVNQLARPSFRVAKGAQIVIGFDGARRRDATALIATTLGECHQWPLGIWERPEHAGEDWEIDQGEVTQVLAAAVKRFDVWRVNCDPHHWGPMIDEWAGQFGDDVINRFDTTKWKLVGYTFRDYREVQQLGQLTHCGVDTEAGATFAAHMGHAYKMPLKLNDEDTGEPLWTLQKERRDSPLKIDAAMAGGLSYRAYADAIALGVKPAKKPVAPRRVR